MPERSSYRRSRRVLLTGISVVALVAGAFAAPAFAHGDSGGSKKCQEMDGMDMCGNGVYHAKGKAAKKAKAAKASLKPGTMVVVDGALTGDSPCEKSGPPASVGQVKKDAEGHDHRGPLYQYPVTQAEREQLIAEQAAARAVAEKYPHGRERRGGRLPQVDPVRAVHRRALHEYRARR